MRFGCKTGALHLARRTSPLRPVRNAAIEEEASSGSSNDTVATAQTLDPTFLSLGQAEAHRGAAVGLFDLEAEDLYSARMNSDPDWNL